MTIKMQVAAVCLVAACFQAQAQLGAAPLPQVSASSEASKPSLDTAQQWISAKFEELGGFETVPPQTWNTRLMYRANFTGCTLDLSVIQFHPAPNDNPGPTRHASGYRTRIPLHEIDEEFLPRLQTIGEREILVHSQVTFGWLPSDRQIIDGRDKLFAAIPVPPPSMPPSKARARVYIETPNAEIKGRLSMALRDVVRACKAQQATVERAGSKRPGEAY